jgi:hypothetical protein
MTFTPIRHSKGWKPDARTNSFNIAERLINLLGRSFVIPFDNRAVLFRGAGPKAPPAHLSRFDLVESRIDRSEFDVKCKASPHS